MSCPPQFWDGVLRRLGVDVPAFTVDAWLRPLGVEECPDGLRLLCPTTFHRERVRERFLARITGCVEAETGRHVPIELGVAQAAQAAAPAADAPGKAEDEPTEVGADGAPAAGAAQPAREPTAAPAPAAKPGREPDLHTFESFVVGPCNALAREASYAVAREPGRGTLNPLYLLALPGLGKTHLARAVVHEARRRGSGRVLYESTEAFTTRFMRAIRAREMDAFKRRYRRQCDLLVLEDMQFLRAKNATQLELFHTLTHLVDAGIGVVLTGDRLPRDIEGLDPRLRSQITAGIVAEIEPPDAVVRRRILRHKAASGGVHLPPECLDLLVDSVIGSVRDLEGALIQLVATASLLKRRIDSELTRMALHKLGPPPAPRLPLEVVIETVAGFFGVPATTLASRSRRRDVLSTRQLAMYLCRRYTDEPLSRIARAFGRDHPSVSNAVRVVERDILERAPLRYKVEEISARLEVKLRGA